MKRRRNTPLRRLSRFLTLLLCSVLLFLGVGLAIAADTAYSLYQSMSESLPSVAGLEEQGPPQTTRLFARDGRLIATLYRQNRKWVSLDEISPKMVQALLAVEDSRFYGHHGVDYRGVMRAAVGNLVSGQIEQGASTLTMQLARDLFLTNERSFERKAREALFAMKLEEEYSKDFILEQYLNRVYFGAGSYGVGAAASRYFGVHPRELTSTQSSLLAGLIQSPSALSPYQNPKASKQRQVAVLDRLLAVGYLSESEYAEARDEMERMRVKPFRKNEPVLKYPYFTTYAIKQLSEEYSDSMLYEGGLNIYTTLDIELQRQAESAVRSIMSTRGQAFGADAVGLVLIENETGAIRAMVGGTEWSPKDRFNRAYQARRQAGSSFKPFLYAAALERGVTPETKLSDSEVELAIKEGDKTKTWAPRNADGRELGMLPVREALRLSRNTVAARLLRIVGLHAVPDVARRLGIDSPLPKVASLALGSGEVTPLEMAEAYSSIARGGIQREPRALKLVANREGEPVRHYNRDWSRMALSPQVAAQLTDMMMRVVRSGTGTGARFGNWPVAGKTGTTDSYKDAWFVGFTPRYTLAVWVGRNDNRPTWGMFGGSVPAEIWRNVMTSAHRGMTPRPFTFLQKPVKLRLCKESHQLASKGCSRVYSDLFFTEVQPEEECDHCLPGGLNLEGGAYPVYEPDLQDEARQDD